MIDLRTNKLALALVTIAGTAAADPPLEVGTGTVKLPAVPTFELPVSQQPGVHNPRELRVFGRKVLNTEIKVEGYITWIYDCATDVKRPGKTQKQIQKLIDADPSLCERKKLYLGTARNTPATAAIWVVDVPRPPNKLEKQRLPKAELLAWPLVPKLAVGNYVTITGTWATRSPHSETNSEGLLVFGSSEQTKPSTSKATTAAPPAPAVVALPPLKPKPPRQVDDATRARAKLIADECLKAYGANQFDAAIKACTDATAAWDGNAMVWYMLAVSDAQKRDWRASADAAAHAVELAPDVAMYQLMRGRALYERAIADARDVQARSQGKKPDEITPDLSAVSFDAALQPLLRAIAREPKLWRAHYLVGAIYRAREQAKAAADSFTAATSRGATEPAPFIALAELYRRWDYTEPALQVARAATVALPTVDTWFELGMVYDDKRMDREAIDAFTKAIKLDGANIKARFMRGQTYARKRDFPNAKRDLDEVVKSNLDSFYIGQAQKILMDIASQAKR